MLLGLLFLFVGQIFGNTIIPIGTKISSPLTGPLLFVFLRFVVATLFLFLLFVFSKKRELKSYEYISFALLGVFLSINVILYTIGIAYTTVIMGTLIYAITPILVGIAGHFYLSESLTKQKILGLIISFMGLCFLVNQSLSNYQQNALGHPIGNILIFIAMLGYTFYLLQSRKMLSKQNHLPIQTTFLTFVFTTLTIFVVLLLAISTNNIAIKSLPIAGILGFLLVGSGSVVQYLFLQIGVKKTSAFTASFFQYLAPFIAAAAAIPLLHEQITLNLIVGGLLILIGVFIATTYEQLKKYTLARFFH